MTASPCTFMQLPWEQLQTMAAAVQLPEAAVEAISARASLMGRLVQNQVLQLDEQGAYQVCSSSLCQAWL